MDIDTAPAHAAVAPLPLDEARSQLRALLAGEQDLVANTANFTAFLNSQLTDINWVGVYFLRGTELVLGPFQGLPACVRIPVGRGVCGVCIERGEVQRVADVHRFDGHIACDPRSRSEMVLPLRYGDDVIGVVDLDSPLPARFSAEDQHYVQALVDEFARAGAH